MIGELEQENHELKETIKQLELKSNRFMELSNEKNRLLIAYHNNLLNLMGNETDIKELKQAFNTLVDIFNIKDKEHKAHQLKEFKIHLDNEPIFNLCLLLCCVCYYAIDIKF